MSKTITDGKVVDYDPFRGRKGADVSACHHCGRPRTGCLGGEACELQARLNEADGTIGELRQRISALETQLVDRDKRISELEAQLSVADEELEQWHPDRSGAKR